MLLGERTGVWSGGGALPYDAKIEWIESDGNAYFAIDEEILKTETFEINYDYKKINESYGFFSVFGSTSYNDKNPCLINYWSGWQLVGSNYTFGGVAYLNADCNLTVKFYKSGIKYSVDGGPETSSSQYVGNRSVDANGFYLFKAYHGGQGSDVSKYHKLKSFKIEDRFNLVPVRKGVEGMLLDTISNKIYRNAGTGAFIIGPDVSAAGGGGYKLKCARRSHRRSSRPSARFCATSRRWEVAA